MGAANRFSRRLLTLSGAIALASCSGGSDAGVSPPPPPPPTQESKVTAVALSGPTVMTASGTVRIKISVEADADVITYPLAMTASTTGPFIASFETNLQPYFRVLVVNSSAPGQGSVTVTIGSKSGSLGLTALPLFLQSISVATGFACATGTDNLAWCWGNNELEQLGLATTGDCNGFNCQYGGNRGNLTPLRQSSGQTFSQIATSAVSCTTNGFVSGYCGTACGLTTPDAQLICWGEWFWRGATLIGAGLTFTSVSVTSPSAYLPDTTAHVCGLTTTAALYCFAPPARTSQIGPGMSFKSLSVGHYHSCAVETSGSINCWGSNLRGNLGIGSIDASRHDSPERVVSSVNFTSVAVGDYSTCALSEAGAIYCWGLGYSATDVSPPPACPGIPNRCQTVPALVEGGGTYVALARSDGSSLCGLTAAGAVSCWTAFNRAPTDVVLTEPLTTISVGLIPAPVGILASGCGISASHIGYCWNSPSYIAKPIGQ